MNTVFFANLVELPDGYAVERDSDGDWVLTPPADVVIFSEPGEGVLLDAGTEAEAGRAALAYLRGLT